jgi:hypothetical protein
MLEEAVAFFEVDLAAAWRLTVAEWRLLARAWRRRQRYEHECRAIHAWMTASLWHRPCSLDELLGRKDPEAEQRGAEKVLRIRAGFDAWWQEQRQAAGNE